MLSLWGHLILSCVEFIKNQTLSIHLIANTDQNTNVFLPINTFYHLLCNYQPCFFMSQYVQVHMHPQFPWCTVLWYQGSYGILLLPLTTGSFLWCHHKLDEVCKYKVSFHSSTLGQNGHHFAADILLRISFNENVINFYSIFLSHLFLRGQLTINQYLFRLWLGTCFVPSFYLNQCWPSSLTHKCGTRGDEFTNQGWVMHIYISKLGHQ